MRIKITEERILALFFFVVLLWFVITASGYSAKARFVPLVIGIPALVLAAYQLQSDWRKPVKSESDLEGANNSEKTRRELGSGLWVVGCFVLIWLVGFTIGLPVYAYAYAKVRGKEGWLISLVPAAIAFLVLWVLFVNFLHIPLYQGILFDLLAG